MKNKCSSFRLKYMGFTLVELMITIAVLGIVTALAAPALFHKQTDAISYAKLSLQHAKGFLNMINNNYASYYNQAQAAVVTIPYSSVISAGYNSSISSTDRYGSSPCAAIKYNANSKSLDIIMYYTNTNTTSTSSSMIHSANNYLNGVAGQIIGNNVVGAFNTWTLPTSSSLFSGIASCNMHTIPNNSLVVYLNLLTTQVNRLQVDSALHRTADTSGNAMGTTGNTNTMQTDIIMGYTESSTTQINGIFFTNSTLANSAPYLTSSRNPKLSSPYNINAENILAAANINVVANSFTALAGIIQGAACSLNNVGQIVDDSSALTWVPVGGLQCRYDILNCAATGNYCYLPIHTAAIRFHAGVPTYTCPTGYYVDLAFDPSLLPNVSAPSGGCQWAQIGPPTLSIVNESTIGSFHLIRSVAATVTWMQQNNTGGGCINGTTTTISTAISGITCARYPIMYDN